MAMFKVKKAWGQKQKKLKKKKKKFNNWQKGLPIGIDFGNWYQLMPISLSPKLQTLIMKADIELDDRYNLRARWINKRLKGFNYSSDIGIDAN